jgi:hypothetical protein
MDMGARLGCTAAGAIASLSVVGVAGAQDPPALPPPILALPGAPETREAWYGAAMLATDAAAIGLLVGGGYLVGRNLALFDASSTPAQTTAENAGGLMFLGGYAGFLFGAPADHFLHGERETGMKSLLVRLLLPPAALLASAGISEACGNDNGGCIGVVTGTLLGAAMLGTVFVDDVLSAREPASVRPSSGQPVVVPRVTVGRFTSVGLAAEL